MIRVFEMTYLDLTKKLKEDIKDKNMQVQPLEVQKDIQINDKGQVIFDQSHQLFDSNACLIDKESRVHKRKTSRDTNGESNNQFNSQNTTQYCSMRSSNVRGVRGNSLLKLSLSPASKGITSQSSLQNAV